MGRLTLSRGLALRIGLAARALPDTSSKYLVETLVAVLGFPLTEAKLSALTLKQYRQALKRPYAEKNSKDSLALLQSGSKHENPVRLQQYHPHEMPHSIRVAVASEDGHHIDGQFSLSKQFYIYQVSTVEKRLIAIRAAEAPKPLTNEQRQSYRAEIIQDCQVLYSQSIGGPAAAKVIKQGVHPIKLNGVAVINVIIDQLQHVLSTSPPPWLAKSMGVKRDIETYSPEEKMT